MARFVYAQEYCCDLGLHVFKTEKYRLVHSMMLETGLAAPEDFARPKPASRHDLEMVHDAEYIDDLLRYHHTERTFTSEMPISRDIIQSFILGAGGTMLACRTASQQRTMTMNLAGGFHHAFPGHAEGFCYINDVALGVAAVRDDASVTRAMVVDCDLHQGNGTAVIFRDQPDVFTFSIHQESIYPIKQQSDLDIGVPDFCSAQEYLGRLELNLTQAMDDHAPELVVYVAGADPYRKDQLGNLLLDMEDLTRRDEIVLGECSRRGIPATVVLAGGYAPDVRDTARIHCSTARTLVDCATGLEEA